MHVTARAHRPMGEGCAAERPYQCKMQHSALGAVLWMRCFVCCFALRVIFIVSVQPRLCLHDMYA